MPNKEMLNKEMLNKVRSCVSTNNTMMISLCFEELRSFSQIIEERSALITATRKEIFIVDKIFREIQLSNQKYKI